LFFFRIHFLKRNYYCKSASQWILVTFLGITCLFNQNISIAQKLDSIRISERFVETPLLEAFNHLENKYSVPFYFKKAWLPQDQLTLSFNEKTLAEVLDQLLKGTKMTYAIFMGNSVIIAPEHLLTKEFSQEYFIKKDLQQNFLNQENWPSNVEIINLGIADQQSADVEFTLKGILKDGFEKDPLAGAAIFVKDLEMAVSSDRNGEFELKLPRGLHLIEIRMLGFETKLAGINVLNTTNWDVELLPEATELDEVLVNATADDSNIKSSIIGMTKLTPLDIKEMPVFLGEPDVIKSILTLPGVSTIGEGASGFNVRGGNIDQNLIMQDNALIFNSSHAMGFFSVFNPDVIRDVTLYKGHIPAQFGGRVSSVLDVKLKGNNYEKLKVNGGIGLLASRLALETPIIKDKTSILVGGRVAYSDWVLRLVNNPNVRQSDLSFYDFNAKISQRLGDKGNLELSYYRSYDKFEYADEFGFSWDLNTIGLKWDQVIKPTIISELSISISESGNASFQPSGIDGFELSNGMDNYKLKEDMLITSLKQQTINAGFEINAYIPNEETLKPFNEISTIIPYSGIKDKGAEAAIYINDMVDLSSRLYMSFGLRYSIFTQFGSSKTYLYENDIPDNPENIIDSLMYDDWEKAMSYQGLEPRFSLRFTVNARSSIKMSYNRINQYIHLISNTTAALPIDYWQVSNRYFKPLRAHNFSLGYFNNFKLNQWETSAEIYYRDLENMTEYKDFPELFLNGHLETELINGRGRSYGLELFIKKKTGKLNGWLSYTYARTFIKIEDEIRDESINGGEWFSSKFDQPHNLNLVGNFNVNRTNQLSFNFTYSTGRPLTGPDSNYSLDEYIIPNYSDRNEFRLPNYHRLDVSYTIQRGLLRTRRYKDSFTFSIYNLYARKNAYSIYFRRNKRNVFGAYKLSILGSMLPSVTYNFKF